MMYTLESKFTKSEIIQASNICFLFGKIIQIILFSFAAVFTVQEMQHSFILLLFVSIALYIGIKIKFLINSIYYTIFVKIILFVIAMLLILQSI